jgi:hypothetical protein
MKQQKQQQTQQKTSQCVRGGVDGQTDKILAVQFEF